MPGIAAGFAVAVLCSAIGASLALSAGAHEDGPAVLLSSLAGFWAALLLTVIVVTRPDRGERRSRLGLNSTWRDAAVGFPIGVVTQLVVPLVYLPLRLLDVDLDLDRPARELLDRGNGATLFLLAIAVVFAAPVIEELFFRGLLLRAFEQRWTTRTAVVSSALVFGATHLQPLQFPALALAGLVFAVLAVHAGRLGPAIWAHAGFNAVTVVALGLLR